MVLPAHQTGSHFTTPPSLSLRPRLPVNRYVLGSDYPDMKKNPDGSMTISLQNKSPGKDKEANWLPVPAGPLPAPGPEAVLEGFPPIFN
jgi:Protein of unknown function (DUF1214)